MADNFLQCTAQPGVGKNLRFLGTDSFVPLN